MDININGYNLTVKTSTFPGGEEYICLPKSLPRLPKEIRVFAELRSSKQIMQLLMVTDALRRYAPNNQAKFILDLDYLPYARQDRVCAQGEAFSLKVACKLINDLNYDEVHIADCHSEVGLALLDNVVHMEQLQCLRDASEHANLANRCDVIVAPDAGAAKKAQIIADWYNIPLVQCLKSRKGDKVTIQVLGDITDKVALVVDDICDGGATFLALAAAIQDKKPKELHLHVTHGIFSKGTDELLKVYDTVGAYDDWNIT